jgi:hypothetical protein
LIGWPRNTRLRGATSAPEPDTPLNIGQAKLFAEISKATHSRLEIRRHCLYQPAMKLIRDRRITTGPL